MATIITERAYDDLEGIADRLLPQYPDYWDQLQSAFHRTFRLLGRHPKIGTDRGHYGTGLRSAVVMGYVVYFRRNSGRTEIVRVLHGSRDVGAASFDGSSD